MSQENKKVVTRFAPSPTGYLHIGGIRTALYNYLFAKQNGGTFYLRIEDTDQERFVAEAEEYIADALSWFGIEADESPWKPGARGPYRQSERDYTDHVQKLIDTDMAYFAFDTKEYVENAKKSNPDFIYNSRYRMTMRNSLTMNDNETREMLKGPYVVRFKTPPNTEVVINDIVRGEVKYNTDQMDDKVLVKSDGIPTYHLANICDDHDMGTTHVIRGEEWLPSAGLHYLIYKAFNWEVPQFAHLPLMLNPNGKGKLSKRSAVKAGIPIFPFDCSYLNDQGEVQKVKGFEGLDYEPEAILNFLVLYGWTPKDSVEIMSLSDMIRKFDINSIHKAGAKFDIGKANYFNEHYVGNIISDERLLGDVEIDPKYSKQNQLRILGMARKRSKRTPNMQVIADIFKKGSTIIPEDKVIMGSKTEVEILKVIWGNGLSTNDWSITSITDLITNSCVAFNQEKKFIMPTLRKVIANGIPGPDVVTIMEILGRNESLHRISIGILQ